jgi:hypothetical protein
MKLFQSFDVILMKKSMLVVIHIPAMEFIYLNLIIVIHYGVQKHFIIVFIIQDETIINTRTFAFSFIHSFIYIHFMFYVRLQL